MSSRAKGGANRFVVHPTVETHFSWLRTRMSTERTLMSWVRTATALIGFGFTIVQFFEPFGKTEGVTPAVYPAAPRYLGLMLIGAGVVGLIISLWSTVGCCTTSGATSSSRLLESQMLRGTHRCWQSQFFYS